MTDLIERLRRYFDAYPSNREDFTIYGEAADAIEAKDVEIVRLTSSWESCEVKREQALNAVARLRAALEFYANRDNYVLEGEGSAIDADDGEIARKALEGK